MSQSKYALLMITAATLLCNTLNTDAVVDQIAKLERLNAELPIWTRIFGFPDFCNNVIFSGPGIFTNTSTFVNYGYELTLKASPWLNRTDYSITESLFTSIYGMYIQRSAFKAKLHNASLPRKLPHHRICFVVNFAVAYWLKYQYQVSQVHVKSVSVHLSFSNRNYW